MKTKMRQGGGVEKSVELYRQLQEERRLNKINCSNISSNACVIQTFIYLFIA